LKRGRISKKALLQPTALALIAVEILLFFSLKIKDCNGKQEIAP
jgi:hypothetical protein